MGEFWHHLEFGGSICGRMIVGATLQFFLHCMRFVNYNFLHHQFSETRIVSDRHILCLP
jgi:hypothetical protein